MVVKKTNKVRDLYFPFGISKGNRLAIVALTYPGKITKTTAGVYFSSFVVQATPPFGR